MGGYLLGSASERALGPFFFLFCPLFFPLFYPLFFELLICGSIPPPTGERVVRVA